MARVLVTGGAGFVGSHLVARLVEQGHQVRVLDDLSTGRLENLAEVHSQIEFLQGDVADPQAAQAATEGVEWVFHHAALASVPLSLERPEDTHRACATGTLVLLEAARRAGVKRFIYAGSSSAYGDQPTAAKRESDPVEPVSPYGAAKLAGEFYCRSFYHSFGLETVVLRYFNIYGPRQDPNGPYAAVIPRFVQAIVTGGQPVVFGDGTQSRDFVHVSDVVQANLLAAQCPEAPGRTFNVGSGRSTTLLELIETLGEIFQRPIRPRFDPPRPGDIHQSLADITLARQVLGYRPQVSLREGLESTARYFADRVTAPASGG